MKVQNSLIAPLIEFYGEPNWDSEGKNPVFIAQQWEESFRSYDDQQLSDAAIRLIRSKKVKTFPTIAQIFEILDEEFIKPRGQVDPYQNFDMSLQEAKNQALAWYEETVHDKVRSYEKYADKKELRSYYVMSTVSAFQKCLERILEQIRTSGKDYSNFNLDDVTTLTALGWQHKYFQNHFENILANIVDNGVEFRKGNKS